MTENPSYLFSARTITSFEDATLNFEQLSELFTGGSTQQAALPQLLAAQSLTLDFGLLLFNAPGGWTTATVTYNTVFTAVPVFLYSIIVAGGSGSSLTSHEARDSGAAASSMLVDMNTSIATATTICWAALGTAT